MRPARFGPIREAACQSSLGPRIWPNWRDPPSCKAVCIEYSGGTEPREEQADLTRELRGCFRDRGRFFVSAAAPKRPCYGAGKKQFSGPYDRTGVDIELDAHHVSLGCRLPRMPYLGAKIAS